MNLLAPWCFMEGAAGARGACLGPLIGALGGLWWVLA